ncbi:MAG: rhomboid family intramembrane serine protease, partial [Ignavibacterium sp.]|nr:rhomboid family intramembrane serine protease [Ignavibacterium sp.]
HITIIRLLGQDNSRVLNGAWWQLFTAIFIHVNIMHLLSNMLFLLIFGIRAETLFTTTEYYAIYLLSGFTGNLLTLLLGSLSIVSAGASGAIFGLFGAVIIYMRKVIKAPVITALIFAILFFLATSLSPGINILAHFGGLVVGLLFGYLIASTREKSKNNYS